jgi:hypothetical protein
LRGNRLRSFLTPGFRKLYSELPEQIQRLADKKYKIFTKNPFHPSLEFQAKGEVWTVAIGRSYRAIARRVDDDLHWVWIGSHEVYNNILQKLK